MTQEEESSAICKLQVVAHDLAQYCQTAAYWAWYTIIDPSGMDLEPLFERLAAIDLS